MKCGFDNLTRFPWRRSASPIFGAVIDARSPNRDDTSVYNTQFIRATAGTTKLSA